jgi:four helix bundle protein
MTDNYLITISTQFAIDTILLCETLKKRGRATGIINQLLRSGTSIGANIHEANYASSRADFINKFQIALKECYETHYWLNVYLGANILTKEEYDRAVSICSKIRKLLISSIKTAKKNEIKS